MYLLLIRNNIVNGQKKWEEILALGLGADHLTWSGGVMVFCFVQNFFFGQHKS